jgi:hypothetical protein
MTDQLRRGAAAVLGRTEATLIASAMSVRGTL